MRRMIEEHELRQIMHSLPSYTSTGFPALVDRCQLSAFGMDRCQRSDALIIGGTVAIDTGCRRRNRSVRRVEDGVVAIAAVHLQLSCVDRMTEGNGLARLIADIKRLWISN